MVSLLAVEIAWLVLAGHPGGPIASRMGGLDHEPPSLDVDLPESLRSPGIVAVSVAAQDKSGIGQIMVSYRTSPKDAYTSRDLLPASAGKWSGDIPIPSGTTVLDLYVVAYDAVGNGPASVGSAEQPLRVTGQPVPESGSMVWGVLGTALIGLLAAIALRRRQSSSEPKSPGRSMPRPRALSGPVARPISQRHSSAAVPPPIGEPSVWTAPAGATGPSWSGDTEPGGPRPPFGTPARPVVAAHSSRSGSLPAAKPISERKSSAVTRPVAPDLAVAGGPRASHR